MTSPKSWGGHGGGGGEASRVLSRRPSPTSGCLEETGEMTPVGGWSSALTCTALAWAKQARVPRLCSQMCLSSRTPTHPPPTPFFSGPTLHPPGSSDHYDCPPGDRPPACSWPSEPGGPCPPGTCHCGHGRLSHCKDSDCRWDENPAVPDPASLGSEPQIHPYPGETGRLIGGHPVPRSHQVIGS